MRALGVRRAWVAEEEGEAEADDVSAAEAALDLILCSR